MGLTDIKGEQVEREDEDTQKRAAISRAQINSHQEKPSSKQDIYESARKSEQSSVIRQKEAISNSDTSEESPEEALPVQASLHSSNKADISPDEKSDAEAESNEAQTESKGNEPETSSLLPGLPRKNVIPARRTSSEQSVRNLQMVKKSTFALENRQHFSVEDQESAKIQEPDEERLQLSEQKTQILPVPELTLQDLPATPPIKREGQAQATSSSNEHTSIHTDKQDPVTGRLSEENGKSTQTADAATLLLPRSERHPQGELPTTPLPAIQPDSLGQRRSFPLSRGRAFFLILLLAIVVINATLAGFGQFFGSQGWGSVFNGSNNSNGRNLLNQISNQLKHTPTPGSTAQTTPVPPSPDQIINALISHMTLDQKLGQMMIVQFEGQSYTPQLDAMIRQFHIGGVLYFQYNIGSKDQLKALNTEMQNNADLPLFISVDQEGGTVDRFINLDGAQPSAESIGLTGDPNNAYMQGVEDAKNLSNYGFNLNLAPVVDVHNVDNSQLYLRTYGNNPAIVTQMAGAYLNGLQKSGKVMGTLKHFPGLGDVSVDPHYRPPDLIRSLPDLNAIDWAPYRDLINQGNVYSIMVTHEYVNALDTSEPSSLSPQVIGILRKQLHFKGVIITDGLTMESITNYYTPGQAAAKAIEAGDDILMGAESPNGVYAMINGIKQAMSSGAITEQRINESVRRILLLKYQMGLLQINP